jgi:hypothetical protein
MSVAGIDFSSRCVDVVLLDEDSDAATWHRFELKGQDAFDRARDVRHSMPLRTGGFWDQAIAIGIEDPRGYNAGALYRIQGAILACLPWQTLTHPLIPSSWRKTVGLAGNASKLAVAEWTIRHAPLEIADKWPQDAFDAYAIAYATRSLLISGAPVLVSEPEQAA